MIELGQVAIIGGGCYGSFYLRQLVRAAADGALSWREILVVDADAECAAGELVGDVRNCRLVVERWDHFLNGWLDADHRDPSDRIVPSPLMPHLTAEWIARQAQQHWPRQSVALVPAEPEVGTPFDWLGPEDGVRYVSHADWICPVHCIEPERCPRIRAPRTWEMSETVTTWSNQRAGETPMAEPALFICRHVSHGVGMYGVMTAFEALDNLERVVTLHGRGELVIGSISACHGAVALLRVEAIEGGAPTGEPHPIAGV